MTQFLCQILRNIKPGACCWRLTGAKRLLDGTVEEPPVDQKVRWPQLGFLQLLDKHMYLIPSSSLSHQAAHKLPPDKLR